ncbi:PP0621 family protein [Pulveribacter sp.]|uniref:PP0621 family protein n=1 Tax=Pulveribacter sp. TaxID=2678893 RepID=UPI003917F608
MLKYLVLLAVVAMVYGLWRTGQRRAAPPPPPASKPLPEPMVRCARCGVHLPRSQALQQDGRSYCSPAHQREG